MTSGSKKKLHNRSFSNEKRKRKEKEKKKKEKKKTKGIPEPAVEEPFHLITFLVFFNRVLLRPGFFLVFVVERLKAPSSWDLETLSVRFALSAKF